MILQTRYISSPAAVKFSAIGLGLIVVFALYYGLNQWAKPDDAQTSLQTKPEPLASVLRLHKNEVLNTRVRALKPPVLHEPQTPSPAVMRSLQPKQSLAISPDKVTTAALESLSVLNQPIQTQTLGLVSDAWPIKRVQPIYPSHALRKKLEGWVEVTFMVDQNGKPYDIRIVAANPEGVFDREVSRAVSQWRFKPATWSGERHKVPMLQRLEFKLGAAS